MYYLFVSCQLECTLVGKNTTTARTTSESVACLQALRSFFAGFPTHSSSEVGSGPMCPWPSGHAQLVDSAPRGTLRAMGAHQVGPAPWVPWCPRCVIQARSALVGPRHAPHAQSAGMAALQGRQTPCALGPALLRPEAGVALVKPVRVALYVGWASTAMVVVGTANPAPCSRMGRPLASSCGSAVVHAWVLKDAGA